MGYIARVLNYDFVPATKKITLRDVAIVDITKIQYIINVTRGVILYDYTYPTAISVNSTNIVTISASTAGMLYTDELDITYDFPIEASVPSPSPPIITGSALTQTFTTGAIINGGKAVFVDTDGLLYPFNILNTAHYGKCVGVAITSSPISTSCTVCTSGESSLIGSGWVAGFPYYISSTSFLTTIPPTLGWKQQIGVGVNNDVISINLETGIELI